MWFTMQDRVVLNVGGQTFHTTMGTLKHGESSMLSAMVSGHWKESAPSDEIFIDRDGTHFRYILNYYRGGESRVLWTFAKSGFLNSFPPFRTGGGKMTLPDTEKEVHELMVEAKYYCLEVRPRAEHRTSQYAKILITVVGCFRNPGFDQAARPTTGRDHAKTRGE